MDRTETSGRGTADVYAPNEKPEDGHDIARLLGRLLAPYVAAELAAAKGGDWVDQRNSPLGWRRHIELAREGAFPAHKEGRRWRALRCDVEAYIRSQPSGVSLDTPPLNDPAPAEDDDPEVRAVLAEVGLDLAPKPRARRARKR